MSRGLRHQFLRTGPLHPAAQAQASAFYRTQAAINGGTVLPTDALLAYAHERGLTEARIDSYYRVRLGTQILRTVEQVDAAVVEAAG